MTTLVLWLFGVLTLASLIIIAGWGRAAWRLYPSARAEGVRWCRPFVIATAMTIHAAGVAIGSGYRTIDMLGGVNADGSAIGVLLANLILIATAKAALVWGIAIDPERRRARWPWHTFVAAMLVWATFCAGWGGGWIDLTTKG